MSPPGTARIPARARHAVFLRSFAIQGSWNYRTLVGGGFAFALLPVLRSIHGDDPERLKAAVRRHVRLFNSHPYLAPIALGAVGVMEAAGEDPERVERFKDVIRSPLGAIGDRLVWAGWRPVCLLVALVAALGGAPWWAVVVAFLALYNVGHVGLRVWAHRVGWTMGPRIAGRLSDPWLTRLPAWLAVVGAFLAGLAVPLLWRGAQALSTLPAASVAQAVDASAAEAAALSLGWLAGAVLAAGAGAVLGIRVRSIVVYGLTGLVLLGFLLNFAS